MSNAEVDAAYGGLTMRTDYCVQICLTLHQSGRTKAPSNEFKVPCHRLIQPLGVRKTQNTAKYR